MPTVSTQPTVLVTGSAGFIGFHTAQRLLANGALVIGLDNLNTYYDPTLKAARNSILLAHPHYKFYRGDLEDLLFIKKIFAENKIDKICHLAAQAGVRHSLTHPHTYIQSNLVGFTNLIDEAKNNEVRDFIYASSSSVYGGNEKIPFAVTDPVDRPISLYAATKKSNELIAYSYHHLYGLNCTGLRFFTVYGPYGRPDMALFRFTTAILNNEPIEVYGHGKMQRDFTYIDDIVAGIIASLDRSYPYEIFNLGNHQPVDLNEFISLIEAALEKKATKTLLPMQPGDVATTYADINYTTEKLDWRPRTSLAEGIHQFVTWYQHYYHQKS